MKTWPAIGDQVYELWTLANENIRTAAEKVEPQLKALGSWLISSFAALVGGLLLSVNALIISGTLLMNAQGAVRSAAIIGRRLGGDVGVEMAYSAGKTIQSVVRGVILIGSIGGLMSNGLTGLFIAPVVFAVGYRIFSLWVEDARRKHTEPGAPPVTRRTEGES